jgi:hypothetical protein
MLRVKFLSALVIAFISTPMVFAGGGGNGGKGDTGCIKETTKAINRCINEGTGKSCADAIDKAIDKCVPDKK